MEAQPVVLKQNETGKFLSSQLHRSKMIYWTLAFSYSIANLHPWFFAGERFKNLCHLWINVGYLPDSPGSSDLFSE